MDAYIRVSEFISKNAGLFNGKITVDNINDVMNKVYQVKQLDAALMIVNGVKTKEALQTAHISAGMIKKLADKTIYQQVKKIDPKPTKKYKNLNKGKKLIRNGKGEVQYVDKIVYDELLESGKIKAKPVTGKKNKPSNIRGGALMNGSDVELFGGSSTSNISVTKKDYSKVGLL